MFTRLLIILAASASVLGCSVASSCEAESTACGCYARRASCKMITETCWCPSECDTTISCVCGGGKFLRCETPR